MNEFELQQMRRAKWRVDSPERALRTIEEAAALVAELGIFLTYPLRPPLVVPTWIGACSGSDQNLPAAQNAFQDTRSRSATELMVRLLRQKSAFEAPFAGETHLLLSAETLPYYYAVAGGRARRGEELENLSAKEFSSPLAHETYRLLQRQGPLSRKRSAERLGKSLSEAAMEHVLNELWARLRIARVDYDPNEGPLWDVLYRWAPEVVDSGGEMSLGEGLSALISKYLEAVVAADSGEIENFFSHFTARSKVKEVVNALLAAHEFSFAPIGRRTLIQALRAFDQPRLNAGQRRPTPAALRAEKTRAERKSKRG
jgi:hypothetical protein